MKLIAFQSDKGDCLLLETENGSNRMLIDGGMRRAYSEHVAPALGKLRQAGKKIDIACISHIDADHIAGVLQLLDDEAAWRVHEYQLQHGNPGHPPPEAPRPPTVGAIFHNSFHDQIGKNSGEIEDMLAATAVILSGADHPWLIEVADRRRELAMSIPEAMRVSRRIKPEQLNILLNPQYAGKLMMVEDGSPAIALGSVKLTVIGPLPDDLTKLRKEWNAWLKKNQEKVAEIRAQGQRDEENLGASEVNRLLGPLLRAAERLGAMELALAKELGNRKKVTAPNLASLMLLAEENGQRVLLTGDGHADDILKGLDHQAAFDPQGKLHVDVLKVQHHGSEHNLHQEFCDRVTGDNYVFCGNGQHENPDLDVLQLIFDRRMASDSGKFKFWFNSSSTESVAPDGQAHMAKVENLAAKLAGKSSARLTNKFIKGDSIRIL